MIEKSLDIEIKTQNYDTNMCLNHFVSISLQTSDWLLIGCARVADRLPPSNTCEDRLCGGTFNAEVSSTEKTVISK